MNGSVLDRDSILELIRAPAPLVERYLDLDEQLQPNGFDLTLKEVMQFTSAGDTGPREQPTALSQHEVLPFEADGYMHMRCGSYLITANEILTLPPHVMALARPRSSLLRCGVAIHSAVWDAGYRGRSQALLTVYNPLGYRLAKDARVLQIVFMYLARPVKEGYRGRFLGENI